MTFIIITTLIPEISMSVLAQGDSDINDSVKVGDLITFGKYEQDGNESNGKEPIEWRVLGVESDRILVVSKYALDCKQFNESYYGIKWEQCSLRSWLNNDFLNSAFNKEEKEQIPLVTLDNKNQSWDYKDFNDTEDYVFCLSFSEVNKYFGFQWINQDNGYAMNQELICTPTQYALNRGVYREVFPEQDYRNEYVNYGYSSDIIGLGGCYWWLRTPNPDAAAVVGYDGGSCEFPGYDVRCDNIGVRPAMYILKKTESLVPENGKMVYYKNGVRDTSKNGFVNYNGGKFLVANGEVATTKNGLAQDPQDLNDWYFCAAGRVVAQKTGLVMYNGSTFYVENGKLNTGVNGFFDFNGGLFFVSKGRVIKTANGLVQDPKKRADWYFCANGQVQKKKTGVVIYNKAGFYVVNGKLDTSYNGNATYNGKAVKIVNGRMK